LHNILTFRTRRIILAGSSDYIIDLPKAGMLKKSRYLATNITQPFSNTLYTLYLLQDRRILKIVLPEWLQNTQ